jgi:intraflagellar transport protein 81
MQNIYRSELKNSLAEGNRNAVYPVLAWMLPRIGELRKRAYLAKYLLNFEVPAEMLNDDGIRTF